MSPRVRLHYGCANSTGKQMVGIDPSTIMDNPLGQTFEMDGDWVSTRWPDAGGMLNPSTCTKLEELLQRLRRLRLPRCTSRRLRQHVLSDRYGRTGRSQGSKGRRCSPVAQARVE